MAFTPGQIINGKYRVLRLLGDGGMGSVYEAHHEVLGTRVALKLLHAELTRTGVAKRFIQEARASARIKSPHVVGVSDADQTPEGHAFIVLEYIEGRTLREMYDMLDRERRRLPFNEALDFAMQMFEGVEAAHTAGIVHRDLKPDNVMVTQDQKGAPLLKLLDFGIAKVDEPPESAGQALTRPGALLGTPEYMAPEQVYSANSADVRSDVFSLGVILFEMLSGRRPVMSDDPQQIAVSYLTGAFSRLEDACPEVPPALATAVHRALAAQPRDRFATVAEMRAAIEPFAPVHASALIARSSLLAADAPARSPKQIPETIVYSRPPSQLEPPTAQQLAPPSAMSSPPASSGPPPTQNDDSPVTRPATNATVPKSGTQLLPSSSKPKAGTEMMSTSEPPPAQATPFTPDYPSAMGPFSNSAPLPGGPAEQQMPYSSPSHPPPPDASNWNQPLAIQPGVPVPKRSNVGLFAGIAVGVLVVGTGITIGSLYYLGWFDGDPPPKPHKTAPVKAHPTTAPAPTHKPPNQLR